MTDENKDEGALPQRRPNRRLNAAKNNKSPLNNLSSSLGSSLQSSTTSAPSVMNSSITTAGSFTSSQTSRRAFSGSLRDRRGLAASTGGSVRISFAQQGGLDNASLREIIAGFDSDDDDDDSSVDSYLAELKRKQALKDTKGNVKFGDTGDFKSLANIESGSSMHFDPSDM